MARSSISWICAVGEGVGRAEVEAQAVGVDQRALLLHVLAEHLAQRPVQDVGAGVVATDGVAALDVDGGGGLLAGLDRALDDPGVVAMEAGEPVGGVVDHGGAGVGADDAGVAHLAAALGVERRAVEEDRHLVAFAGDDGEHGGLGLHLLAADELGGAVVVEDLLEARAVGVDVALLARLLGAGALLLHQLVEGGEVDADPALGRHLLGDLDREAEGVVELEGDVAGHLGRVLGEGLLEQGDAPA